MEALSVNKRAAFDYEILEKYTAGIVLTGHETKSAKMGRMSLAGAYAIVRNGEAFLIGSQIPSFQPNNEPLNYDSQRTRKLLLTKKEINHLTGKIHEGLTVIPLKVFQKKNLVKIELGLGRGRKKHDKREFIKKREIQRDIKRIV